MNIGKWLKQKRIRDKKTQMDLASQVGYSSGQLISNIERGLATPPDEVLVKICKENAWNFNEARRIILKNRDSQLRKLYNSAR